MTLSEDALCEIFADGMRDVPEFRQWVLAQTVFAEHAETCRLLDQEQLSLRPRKRWWRHWWCHVPELDKDRETDVFMVFATQAGEERFALHVENKRDHYRFNPGQAAAYEVRARHMLNKPEYLSHARAQTVLLAPLAFRDRHADDTALFDVYLSYEDVAAFLPAFTAA